MLLLELYIVYLKQYDTYYDTHEAIFYMYEQYILFSLIPKKHDMSTNFMGIWEI